MALSNRPLGAFASSFYICSCVFYAASGISGTWLILASFVVFCAVMLAGIFRNSSFRGEKATAALAAGALAAALYAGLVTDVKLACTEELSGEERYVSGVVTSVRYASSYEGCYIVKTDRSLTDIGGMSIILYADDGELDVGDRISCTVNLSSLEESGDFREYMLSNGVVLSAEALDGAAVSGQGGGFIVTLSKLRSKLAGILYSGMSEESGGFSAALLLGDRDRLPDSVKRDFRALGISHLLALSGTHLTALFASLSAFIPRKGRTNCIRFFILCPAVIFYMALTGFSSSVVRAGIMFILTGAGEMIDRKSDRFTLLSVSVLLICLVNPYAPFDTGLQLSYASVVGLIISDGLRAESDGAEKSVHVRIFHKVLPALIVPAAILPLMWLKFGEVSLISPVANLIFVPVVSILIPALGILLLTYVIPPLFIPLASAADFAVSSFLKVLSFSAGFADSSLPLRGASVAAAVIVFTVLFAASALYLGKQKHVLRASAVMALSIALLLAQLSALDARRGMTVCYASSGQDDGLCVFSGGYTVLIDVGRYPSALKKAAGLGADHGSGRIDALVLSHLHRGHRLTLSEICGNYYVESLWMPVPYDEASEYVFDDLSGEAEKMGMIVNTYIPGEKLIFGECEFSAPSLNRSVRSDHPVVSFSVRLGERELMYLGSGEEGGVSPDGCVCVLGTHGPEPKGVPSVSAAGDDGMLILSCECAGKLDAVPLGSVISDSVVIRFESGLAPYIKNREYVIS